KAASAAAALPNWFSRPRNVAGPTLSERIRRSHARRCSSVSRVSEEIARLTRSPASGRGSALSDLAFAAGNQAADIGVMLGDQYGRQQPEHPCPYDAVRKEQDGGRNGGSDERRQG